ncbi:peptidoglycan-binding domain-containing protein [Actinophytocola sp.]|uniref:peptidoglycan-binding domain-containing protein n=1 Tax=Actinophytocola sp. TaxID=1872138 RepID=UPI002ED657D6
MVSPQDLLQLPEYIELAKKLGVELKDLIDARNSTAINVVNRTQHALVFIEELREAPGDWAEDPGKDGSGALRILPPNRIEPGDTATFLSGETPNSILTGDEGWCRYAIGAPEHAHVLMHWNNPAAGDNTGDVQIAFPSGQTRPDGTVVDFKATVAFAQAGSVMSPYEFVVLEEDFGGGGDGVVDRNSCEITVINETRQTLYLNETHFDAGDAVTFPDDDIPPDSSTTFTVSEKLRPDHRREGVVGFARFSVTQDPSHALWTVFWSNTEVGDNIADNRLDGASAALYQMGPPQMPRDRKEETPVRFILRDANEGGGGGGGGGQPREEPPPETDEPTLRHGDESVDGWVEYLQELLNLWGHPVTENGVFDDETLRAVWAFQDRRDAMVDGIVGNQTWALLRQEDPRPPSTDGREPHTYVEQGPEARWITEDEPARFHQDTRVLALSAYNVGNVPIGYGQFPATVDLTPVAGGDTVQLHLTCYSNVDPIPVHTEFSYGVEIAPGDLPPGEYTLHAWMPAELGGDDVHTTVTI